MHLPPVKMTAERSAHCPGYHAELLPTWVDSITRRHEIASQVGVTLHALYSALPEHHEFVIVEADSPAQVGAFVVQLHPTEQAEIEMTALTTAEDLLAMAARMSG